MTGGRPARDPGQARGRLRIGDDWNAITIIALSQSNPLKAIAELVENSIDAKARAVTLTRGRQGAGHYLTIRDDGGGVPLDPEGRPDFRYVATHICDSVKRRLKESGATGIQGEFGIGLLSFWTIGESLAMTCAGADQRSYQMVIRKGDPGYSVSPKRTLIADGGTEVHIAPLLEGMRGSRARRFSGTSPRSCATGSATLGSGSRLSIGSRASSIWSSRASTRASSYISYRRGARGSATCMPSCISMSRARAIASPCSGKAPGSPRT